MIGRPRCREWTPLATQQLRLRNLIQIVGYNIRPPDNCLTPYSFYITLHHSIELDPFYTSERISSPHPRWKEIDSEITQCMSSRNVVIKIWCHTHHATTTDKSDVIIATWGGYFNGLRYIGSNLASNFTSECFKSNTLVFQMHGGYFCSYRSLKLDIIPAENEIEYSSVSSDSSGKTCVSKPTKEVKSLRSCKSKNIRTSSPSQKKKAEKEFSKSHSPVENSYRHNFPPLRPSPSLEIYRGRNAERSEKDRRKKEERYEIFEHSPSDRCDTVCDNSNKDVSSNIDISETAESYDLRNQTDITPKYRYLCLSFLKTDIRPSYDAEKLQRLHLLQYTTKKRQDAVNQIKECVYRISAVDRSSSEISEPYDLKKKIKSRQKNLFSLNDDVGLGGCEDSLAKDSEDRIPVANGPRLGLKLNDLLNFKTKPSPRQRARHLKLTKQKEIMRFKNLLLKDEINRKMENIKSLQQARSRLNEENQDIGLELLQNYHTLSRKNEMLKEIKSNHAMLRDHAARSHTLLINKRCSMLEELHRMFYIEQKNDTTWTILNVPVPICADEAPKSTVPVRDAVGAGYIAQATCLAAYILHMPLRYKITLLGSASKIQDSNPNLPDPNIPLFARGGDGTLFRYGMFLLNKCIAQMLWSRGLHVTDLRPTLANLRTLLTTPISLSSVWSLYGTNSPTDVQCSRTQSLRSLLPTDRCTYRQFNRFKDMIDGHPPQKTARGHRHTKSVGSCEDNNDLHISDMPGTSIVGSEPNIYHPKLPSDDTSVLKSHNSESELTKTIDPNSLDPKSTEKVTFLLGEDVELSKLVRMSTNNLDSPIDMKTICSEIEDFCKGDVELERDSQNSEVPIEEIDKYCCETCASNVNGDCNLACANTRVSEVIVIDSAEAILDAGP